MFFRQIHTPGLSINSYLIGDDKVKGCIVIDPTRHVIPYIVQTQDAGLEITAIVETHVHADFVSGSKELKHQLNDKPRIYSSGMGGTQWIPAYTDIIVMRGTQIKIGDLRLEAIHTPGHTPEHVVWVCYDESRSSKTPWFVFSGDCLLVGSVGRPDLLGTHETPSLASQLYHSLFDSLAPLPDFVGVFPAHGDGSLCGKALQGPTTTILGYERLFNPYFKKEPEKTWVDHLQEDPSPIPPYFKRMKKVNVEGPSLLSSLKTAHWSEEKSKPSLDQLFLVDIRLPEIFANSHLKGSINIPVSSTFSQWAGWMLPAETPIGLIIDHTHPFLEMIDQLRLIGFDQEFWIIQLEQEKYKLRAPFDSFAMKSVEDLAKLQPRFESCHVVDVRTLLEWESGHIQGTHHLELNVLENSLDRLPHDRPIVLICRSGHRASLAASLLKKQGFLSVMNVRGGMQAWKQAGLPIVSGNKNKK